MPKTEMDRTGSIIIKICIFSIAFSLTALLLCALFYSKFYKEDDQTLKNVNKPVIVIDAGHGGEDGGAISANGIKEKDLNLDIALTVGDILKSSGYNIIMTRSEDKMLYTEYEKGTLKMQDLRKRLEIANTNENVIFLSIHMNKFSQSKYSGAQVFYSRNKDDSKVLADTIQKNIKSNLQIDNNRETKSAGSNIYLLNNIKQTAVLVECGFLSNEEECALLCTDKYQKELSLVISSSVIEFLNK